MRNKNRQEGTRRKLKRIQPLLSHRHETLRQRSSLKPSQLLHIPQHGTISTKPVAQGYCRERVRPDGRRKNVKVAGEHSPTTPGSSQIRGRPTTIGSLSNRRPEPGH